MLLIVGDGIREGVERMLGYLHDHSQRPFTFGLMELGIYENPDVFPGRILIPSLVAKTTEVVRAVVRVETSGPANVSVVTAGDEPAGYRHRILSEEVFLQELPDEATRQLYQRLFDLADELGLVRTWRSSSVSLRLPDPTGTHYELTLLVLGVDGGHFTGWLPTQLVRPGLPSQLALDYVENLCRIFQGVRPHPSKPGSLSRDLTAAEVAEHFDELAEALREVKVAIESAAGGSRSA